MELDERFDGQALDPDVWFPYYLPHWSSRENAAATYEIGRGELRLSIPSQQPLWCPEEHEEPIRVSCIQTGSFSGPVGSMSGQQPFKDGLTVTEEQPTFWGYTPVYGHVEVTMRGNVGPGSMFAFWMSGIEDLPDRSGEICVAEVFGSGIGNGGAEIGMGIKSFRDPSLTEEFSADGFDIDVTKNHIYGVDWRPDGLTFTIDDQVVKRSDQSPGYPMQLMIGVFDFPARAPESSIPELVVTSVSGRD